MFRNFTGYRACHVTHLLNFCFMKIFEPNRSLWDEKTLLKSWCHLWLASKLPHFTSSRVVEQSQAELVGKVENVTWKWRVGQGRSVAHRRAVVTGGRGCWGHAPPQKKLADQLTLSQPDYSNHITTWIDPLDFQTFLRPITTAYPRVTFT